jgi:glyoxylase-like metal-dependent hydrolase (beta-lactamase superfamily II)
MTSCAELWVKEPVADVFRLGTPYVGFYLMAEGGKFTLVDSGLPGYWNLLVRFLTARGSTIADIEAQVLTHHHADHRGNTPRAQQETRGPVYIHPDDVDDLKYRRPARRVPLWRPEVFRYFLHQLAYGVLKTRPVLEVETFEDGSMLDVPGRPQVVHVPGHTRGHCCLYMDSKRAVITGDALVGMNLVTGEPGWRIAPGFINQDSEMALESLGRLERLDADYVLTMHGLYGHGPIEIAVREARIVGVY